MGDVGFCIGGTGSRIDGIVVGNVSVGMGDSGIGVSDTGIAMGDTGYFIDDFRLCKSSFSPGGFGGNFGGGSFCFKKFQAFVRVHITLDIDISQTSGNKRGGELLGYFAITREGTLLSDLPQGMRHH
jgi:hypothetical protein